MTESLSETAGLATSSGETTSLAVLVDGGDDPVDAGIVTDGIVLGVNEDDLEVLVSGVLSNPVGVENTEVSACAANLALSLDTEGALVLQLTDTLSGGLSVDNVGHSLSLAASAANLHSVDNVALLSLVSEAASLLGTSGAGATVNRWQLAVLPGADAQQKAHSVRLLLLPELLKVLVGSHVDVRGRKSTPIFQANFILRFPAHQRRFAATFQANTIIHSSSHVRILFQFVTGTFGRERPLLNASTVFSHFSPVFHLVGMPRGSCCLQVFILRLMHAYLGQMLRTSLKE